ncbi:phage protein, HK97 gp10 family [Sphingomonas guangdongensis]|uniref:Phage protein, HK97 gp10 family n=1 Tax=Sphingomonas guangdongensis TaxID=1141890 RepID=A0A285QXR6_9SPHN|nr:HK97-gp10 family putative phage morphogenesis protein [Sphingomonas guangdongensis]SOB86765.1 phage protein, HK97 gp10 family [Sphingomonas guangdongensis]
MSATANLRGFKELQQRLRNLADKEATQAGQAAVRAAAKEVAKKIEAAAPDGPRAEGQTVKRRGKGGSYDSAHRKIRNHVIVRKGRPQKTTMVRALIGIDTIHAHMVEYGTIHQEPQPFAGRTLERETQAAIDTMAKTLDRRLIKRGV